MEIVTPNGGSSEHTCAATLQAAQKRARTALFLSLAASCIVILMVSNLFESHHLRNTSFIKDKVEKDKVEKDKDPKTEYQKSITSHIADMSYYQLPALGIQVSCEDVGLFGPLALLIFSLYSMIAFSALECHVKCSTQEPFASSPIVQTLLETENPPSLPNVVPLLRLLLFLPVVACGAVACYAWHGHLAQVPSDDPLREIFNAIRFRAEILDVIGLALALVVLACNLKTFKLAGNTARHVKRHQAAKRPGMADAAPETQDPLSRSAAAARGPKT